MDFNHKVAVITGAASGMGAATAKSLAARGAKLALLDLNFKAVTALAKELDGYAVECDVSSSDSAQQSIQSTIKKFNAIHINVNCAGIAPAARVVNREGVMALADFSQVININLVGTFNVLRLCAAQMVSQDPVNDDNERGVIINTASVAATEGQIGQAAYSASKAGVIGMGLPIARELGKFGLRIMTIAPGIIATPMLTGMPDKVQESLAAEVVCPKRLGQADEYARLVEHIISNAYLNGSVIRLDGAIRLGAK
ncbi:MAG: SDR family oxidoreductase [Gammaproteobacteria bacterium]|nr:SDR family oxidoreductase [Gammaproteobacteria bacterium]